MNKPYTIKTYTIKTLAESPFDSTLVTPEKRSPRIRTRQTLCSLLDNAHSLDRAARALDSFTIPEEMELIALQRVRDRVDDIAQLISEATESLRLVGVDKNASIIEFDGELIGLQELSRRMRSVQLQLAEQYTAIDQDIRSTGGSTATTAAGEATTFAAPIAVAGAAGTVATIAGVVTIVVGAIYVISEAVVGIKEEIEVIFNQDDDDRARERISAASAEEIQRISDNELVSLIDAMLDGPTGDDDERAILKILESLDCEARKRIVNRVGVDELDYNLDGSEWDRLMILLEECLIIGVGYMDDDASRLFVRTHSCAQLGQLAMSDLRQLVLNMFSGSCGDEDEDAILQLLRCQSRERLHQLVNMPGTDVGRFDYNFDGDQWDELDSFFAANGIRLD